MSLWKNKSQQNLICGFLTIIAPCWVKVNLHQAKYLLRSASMTLFICQVMLTLARSPVASPLPSPSILGPSFIPEVWILAVISHCLYILSSSRPVPLGDAMPSLAVQAANPVEPSADWLSTQPLTETAVITTATRENDSGSLRIN